MNRTTIINIIVIIIRLLVFYGIVLFLSYCCLSKLDRLVLKSLPRFLRETTSCSTWNQRLYYFLVALFILPFWILVDRYAFAKFTEGALYNAYGLDPQTIHQTEDKLYMHNVFIQENIPTPDLYAFSDANGKWTMNPDHDQQQPFVDDATYIIKPRFGCLGNGVKTIKGKDVLKSKPNMLVQEFLQDCTNLNRPRHYRVVTMYDGTVFCTMQLSSLSNHNDSITSNLSQGTTVTFDPIPPEVDILSSRVANFHKDKYPGVLSIGWDIMYECGNGTNPPRALVLELNVAHMAIHDKSPSSDIQRYLDYANQFIVRGFVRCAAHRA